MNHGIDTDLLAAEFRRAGDFELHVSAVQLVQIVCMMQIALRHPMHSQPTEASSAYAAASARAIIGDIHRMLEGFPTMQAAISEQRWIDAERRELQ